MQKTEKIRLIYAVFIAIFTVAIGLAIICVAADIYYSGKGADVIYSREIVGARLEKLAIPLIIYIATVIVGAVFPLYEVKANKRSEDSLKKLTSRMPASGEGEEYVAAQKAYKKYEMIKYIAWGIASAFALASAIASLCYLCDTANFAGEDTKLAILGLVKLVMPLTICSLALFVAASVVSGIFAKKQIKEMGTLIKHGEGKKESTPIENAKDKAESIANHPITVWAVRGVIAVIGIVFIIVGALNGGAHDVLIKAINICTECIGLG